MRIRICHIAIAALLFMVQCKNIEDVDFAERKTFVRLYEGIDGQLGIKAVPVPDGYVLLTNSINENNLVGYVIKTDNNGNTQWKTELEGTFQSLVVGPDGYYLAGDSIKVNPAAEQVADLVVASAVLYKVSPAGTVMDKFTIKADTVNKVDFRSSALTFNEQDELIMLGTFNAPSTDQEPYLVAFSTALDTLWTRRYAIIGRDYVNAKSIHSTGDGRLVWATAILREQGSFSRSYMMVPYVVEQSVFENAALYGETTDQQLLIADVQPAASPQFGYAIVGSYATPAGDNSNVFFSRVTASGNIIPGSERFFDGATEAVVTTFDVSQSEDRGTALCSTSDGGFVLAGTRETLPGIGNGSTDILLIKVDAQGDVLWRKTLGGSNAESVGSIVETADKGLLICGSVDALGLPALILIKTDENGEITN